MPFIDLDNCETGEVVVDPNFDFTIIGCGAVGIHLALLLAENGKSVLMVESGKIGEQPAKQALNDSVTNRRDIKSSIEWGRKRALGGTTIRWGGQALPFQPIDFAPRPWLDCPGWPFAVEDLATHYRRAESYMGVGSNGYFATDLHKLGLKLPFESSSLDYHVSKWAPEPNMFRRHEKKLRKAATVLFNAHCISIQTRDGRCQSLTIGNFRGSKFELPVKNLILATGGVESVRMLLINKLSKSPVLGRGFMEHPCMDLGQVATSDPKLLQSLFAARKIRGQKYGIRLSLSDQAQRIHKVTNASASLMFETPESAFEPLRSVLSFLKSRNWESLLPIVKHPFAYIQSALMYSRFGISWRPYAQIRLTVMCEQLATDESLIELDHDNLDAFGVPKMRLTWKIGREPWRAAQCISRQVKAILEASLPCEVFLRPELTATSEDFDSSVFTSVNHHMGGAVMGIEPTRSVVNPQLRLHDFENIWVCSASTFPTGSHSNPTLTALALGGRLVDHLSSKNKAK